MEFIIKKINRWLLPAVLILFILQVITLPYVLGITYSGRSESPDHILTYTQGKLTWDKSTGIGENGVAEMDLFDAVYDNVTSENGENVVAPGTEGFNIIRLKNDISNPISYTAVLYQIKSSELLPVEAGLSGEGFADTITYSLPEGVKPEQVIRAVEGTLNGEEIQDFDINWLWTYFEDETQDEIDTLLGDKAAYSDADRVTVGIYIVVEDNNSYITPEPPKTGDNTKIGMYLALMCIVGIMLIILLFERRRERQCED